MSEEVFVYADRLDFAPGDTVRVFASSSKPAEASVRLVKPLAGGDTDGVEFSYEPVATVDSTQIQVAPQHTYNGSFGVVADVQAPASDAWTIAAYIWPTRINGETQTILSWRAAGGGELSLVKDAGGRLAAQFRNSAGTVHAVTLSEPLNDRQWYLVSATILVSGELAGRQVPVRSSDPRDIPREAVAAVAGIGDGIEGVGELSIATGALTRAPDGQRRADTCFDGKIDSPAAFASALTLQQLSGIAPDDLDWSSSAFASWRFDSQFDTAKFGSQVDGQPNGVLHNAPTRGMTGRNWTGKHLDFRYSPSEYGAIHFHSDDIEDAAWSQSAELTLPIDLPSGIYCVLVETAAAQDHVPVFVSPLPGQRSADVLFLAPTFSYIAYANSRLAEELDYSEGTLTNLTVQFSERDQQIYAHREFGMSLYDHHVDGSGNCYSTTLRPIPNMRWDFRSALQSAPRHFAADLLWPGWFEHEGIDYDVLADHALHERGAETLSGYKLIITGSHPEYWSAGMLDSMEEYLAGGGSLAYTGGNGFYWVTSASEGRPHLLEVRRGQQGIRTWESEPGETTSTQSAEPGGLWRLRGRAPNKLVGVGMAAQGWDTSTPGFAKTEQAGDPRVADLFAGIDEDVIGDYGLVLGGAAGDEIDRADVRLGTPRHTLVVARSQPHSQYYLAAPEELTTPTPNINGTNNPNVHADITFFETGDGGFVVSTSAITWLGSMAYRHFTNNAATFMRNVVSKAIRRR